MQDSTCKELGIDCGATVELAAIIAIPCIATLQTDINPSSSIQLDVFQPGGKVG
jgi:hypothetical protein